MSEDNQTIQRILAGDTELFRLLVERYQRPVIKMARNLTGDTALCEDIAQDVFFTAYKKLASFDESRSSFSTWLFTIARNKSINAAKRKTTLTFHELPEDVAGKDAPASLVEKEFFLELEKNLDTLPNKLKTAFVLGEIEELSYEDIAHIERATVGTIRVRISRAKEKLRTAFERCNETRRL
jgi:RNA polymerase sigma-70 factor (ECF subfamily)